MRSIVLGGGLTWAPNGLVYVPTDVSAGLLLQVDGSDSPPVSPAD